MDEPPELVAYLNGRVLPQSQVVAAFQGKDLQSSGGFYDTERTFNGQLYKLPQHLERLYRSLTVAEVDPGLRLEEMENATRELLDANRHMLGAGDELVVTQVVSLSPIQSPDEIPTVNVVISCQLLDFSEFAKSYVQGVRVVTPATYGAPKRDSQSGSSSAGQQVVSLMTGREGNITECDGASFLFVGDGRLKLPDRRDILPGISMQTVLELTESLGTGVDEDRYSAHDVYLADEAFVASTRYCMLPVATLNGYRLGENLPGPVTRRLLDAWAKMVDVDFVRQAQHHLPPNDTHPPPDKA